MLQEVVTGLYPKLGLNAFRVGIPVPAELFAVAEGLNPRALPGLGSQG